MVTPPPGCLHPPPSHRWRSQRLLQQQRGRGGPDEAALLPQMLHVPVLISNTKRRVRLAEVGAAAWCWPPGSSPGVLFTSVGCFHARVALGTPDLFPKRWFLCDTPQQLWKRAQSQLNSFCYPLIQSEGKTARMQSVWTCSQKENVQFSPNEVIGRSSGRSTNLLLAAQISHSTAATRKSKHTLTNTHKAGDNQL